MSVHANYSHSPWNDSHVCQITHTNPDTQTMSWTNGCHSSKGSRKTCRNFITDNPLFIQGPLIPSPPPYADTNQPRSWPLHHPVQVPTIHDGAPPILGHHAPPLCISMCDVRGHIIWFKRSMVGLTWHYTVSNKTDRMFGSFGLCI